MALETLKRRFQQAIGLVQYDLSDDEFIQICERVVRLHPSRRTRSSLKEITTSITGVESFLLLETVDNSDINYIIGQIEDILNNR